jgi:N-acetylglucosaminyldiphosphoundecaprenol N-acetyl-beta-D-mannosaminyltransferase
MSAPSPAVIEFSEGKDARIAQYRVLGVRVHAVQIPEVIATLEGWIVRRQGSRYVAVTGMHGVMEAQHSDEFSEILEDADLVVPDGMPLVWLGRRAGFSLARRVYGPELMETFCRQTASYGYRHFFYGGAPKVAEQLASTLKERFSGLEVAGTISPPYRELTQAEDQHIVQQINAARADILWVGLSTPKQERWMHQHCDELNVPVMLGVGAAFDFLSQRVRSAPNWMKEYGLEWLYRLGTEPRRLWRRYLLYGTKFVWLVGLEQMGLKSFGPENEPIE